MYLIYMDLIRISMYQEISHGSRIGINHSGSTTMIVCFGKELIMYCFLWKRSGHPLFVFEKSWSGIVLYGKELMHSCLFWINFDPALFGFERTKHVLFGLEKSRSCQVLFGRSFFLPYLYRTLFVLKNV